MQLCWIWLWGGFVRSWFVMNFKRWYGEGKEAGRQVDLSPTPLQTHGKEPGRRAIGACKLHALCAPTTTARTYWCRPQALVGNACPHCTSAIISFVWASPPFIPPLNHKAQVYEHHDWWYSLTMLLWIPLSPLASSNSVHACYFSPSALLREWNRVYESLPACRVMGRFDPNHSWFMWLQKNCEFCAILSLWINFSEINSLVVLVPFKALRVSCAIVECSAVMNWYKQWLLVD